MTTGEFGFFGKLPAHGDFIDRGLPRAFIGPWDHWLQGVIGNSRELLGTAWRDHFLVAPIWRFVLTPGICGPLGWHGLMMPSVDRVNRYFPLTIAMPHDPGAPTLAHLTRGADWFSRCEEVALSALSTLVDADALLERLRGIGGPNGDGAPLPPGSVQGAGGTLAWQFALPAAPGAEGLALCVAESLLRQGGTPYSLWWSEGSASVEKSLLIHHGLPSRHDFTAMLDSQWQRWGWGVCRVPGPPDAGREASGGDAA